MNPTTTRLGPALLAAALVAGAVAAHAGDAARHVTWRHLSTKTGDLEPPNAGHQQTSLAVADFDGDGVNDFVVTERTQAPSVLLYRRTKTAWDRYVVDAEPQHIEAGSEAFDIDGDGDQDVLVGGDWMSNRVWWYENPSPRLEPGTPWPRHTVKDFGATKHHDQAFGDFDGDGRAELAFWNQGGRTLYVCDIPDKPAAADRWPCAAIYTWSEDSEMLQRQTRPYPGFKAVNEHEGFATADIDGDGKLDLVGGGHWFKHTGGASYAANVIDASYQFTRSAVGQLVEGGRPEVVLTVGDGWAPLMLYEWREGAWVPAAVLPEVDCTHSLRLVDFDGDGHLDVWVAEMRLDGGNPDAKNQILFGDGNGHFEPVEISKGIDLHESEIADLDGDGDLDVLGKPYNWDAPRLDVWINEGPETPAAPALAAEPPAPFALRDGDRVVFYGDSITQEGGYGRFVEEYVRTRFPQWDVRFYNAGVGGDTVRGGGAGPVDVRLERDAIALRPTVVTIMLGMNDGGYKPFDPMTLAAFGEGYRALVAKLQQALPGVRLTFIRSSPFDDVSRPPQFAPGYDDALRRLGCYVAALGAKEKATVVDFRDPVNAGIVAVLKANPELAEQVVPDRVHPGPAGHAVMGAFLLRAWNAPSLVTRVEIDAAGRRVVTAENAEVSGLAVEGEGLSWTQLDRALPLPIDFEDAETELAQRAGADLEALDQQPLVVTGLVAGRFELKIDGQEVGAFSDAELAKGVNLARYRTPMRRQAYAVKWSVGGSHERQRVRRGLLVAAAKDPSLKAAAETLAAQDENAQSERRLAAQPKPRRYDLVPVK